MSAVARKPLKIYGVPFSVHTRKVMLAARLESLPFELVPVVPVRPETLPADWRRISPTGLIPAIDDDGFTLSDSTAICLYFAQLAGAAQSLPEDARDRARAVSLDAFAGGFFRQVVHPVFHQQVVGPKLRGVATDAQVVEGALSRAAPEAFAYWEGLVDGELLIGARLSLADLAVMSNLLTLRYLGHGPDAALFPKLHACDMVLLLADALDVPLRERNEWLLAAGFAPGYAESALEAPSLSGVSQAVDAILAQQEPFPAVVMNRAWDIVRANQAAARFFGFLLGERRESAPNNVLRLFFHPDYVKRYVVNWEAVARSLASRARREALASGAHAVLDEVLSYPDAPSLSPAAEASPQQPVLPVEFHKEGRTFRFFSAITTLGTPQDVTLQELRIESFFPSDEATRSAARELSGRD
jgi:glutathione S-transferase